MNLQVVLLNIVQYNSLNNLCNFFKILYLSLKLTKKNNNITMHQIIKTLALKVASETESSKSLKFTLFHSF